MLILGSYVLNKHVENGREKVQVNLSRILKSKKGISPILATLLLIVIAVAAIVITYAWVMTFMGAQTAAGGTLLDVENVSWNSTATSIVVRNIGTSDARIVRLYVGASASKMIEVTSSTNLGTGKFLPTNEILTVVLSWPNGADIAWNDGERYYFKVVPETGNPLEFSRVAS
jgi:flagellin-like protein